MVVHIIIRDVENETVQLDDDQDLAWFINDLNDSTEQFLTVEQPERKVLINKDDIIKIWWDK